MPGKHFNRLDHWHYLGMAPNDPVKESGSSSSRAWEAVTPVLDPWILDAVASMGFQHMTPVQASTIPLFTGHKDVVVEVCISEFWSQCLKLTRVFSGRHW